MKKPMALLLGASLLLLAFLFALIFLTPRPRGEDIGAGQLEQRARKLVEQGEREYEAGLSAREQGDWAAADQHYREAYECFVQAHELYWELVERYPDSRFSDALRELEMLLYETTRTPDYGVG